MSRTLAIISSVSLVLCLALFGAAWMIGGSAVFHDPYSFRGIKPLIDLATRKEWRWDGGDTLALDAPVNIRYQASGPQRITVTGNADQLQHVRVGGGRIATDNPRPQAQTTKPSLDAVVSGMALRKFVVHGHQKLDLGVLDQDQLDVEVHGGGSVSGSGRVSRLNLVIAGSGSADLAGLSVQDAKVAIMGSGHATVAPHGELNLAIMGSGNVFLAAKPVQIHQTITGSGRVLGMEAGTPPPLPQQPPEPPQPPLPPPAGGGSQYVVRDNSSVDIGSVDQKSLQIIILASGKFHAVGKVENLSVQIMGSGKAELGQLAAESVTVRVTGSGDVTIAPKAGLQVFIAGSGKVHLRTRPTSISRSIMGSGRVIEEY
jgi:hypothetical protein